MIEFKLPSLGAEMDEGKLIQWKVKPGDAVKKGDVVAVVDTSKSAIDVEIWDEGTICELALRAAGDGAGRDRHRAAARARRDRRARRGGEAERPAAARPPPSVQRGPRTGGSAAAAVAGRRAAAGRRGRASRRRRAPGRRRSASTSRRSPASGRTARSLLEDVEKRARRGARRAPKDRGAEMRRAIAAAMARSKREIPHYYLATDIPLGRASRWLAARNEAAPSTERVLHGGAAAQGRRARAAQAPAAQRLLRGRRVPPRRPASIPASRSRIRQGGLIAPAIRDADAKSLDELMRQLADLVARARALTLRSSELSDPTITVTNLGDQGVDLVQGVIYPPQVALVGFGKVAERPWVEDGALVVTPVVTASLSADHRVSDGHGGAAFLDEIARLLQAPEQL